MKVTNPFTEEVSEVQEIRNLESIFQNALARYQTWSTLEVKQRVEFLQTALAELTKQGEQIALLISEEVGKPIKQSRIEIERSIEEFDFMLKNAEKFLEAEKVDSAEITFAPLGVVAVISPWNFPIMLPLRGIVPALLAGNTVIFKPSELSSKTGLKIFEIFKNLINENPLFIAVGGKDLGEELISQPVVAIAFTGSTAVGKKIAQQASNTLKRVLLELGGLDAAIVLADADIKKTAEDIVKNNARNSGQVCNAIKRVLVHESVYDDFLNKAIEVSKQLVYGDPLAEQTDVGPLVSKTQFDRVKSYLEDAVLKGAKLSQVKIKEKGYLFPQTILSDVPESSKLLQEEAFGPILPVIKFSTEEEAIEIANNTNFGLTASVWTKNSENAKKIAKKLDVGMVRQNTHAAMNSGIPWGGTKESGVGRMKTKEGLREFTNTKVIA